MESSPFLPRPIECILVIGDIFAHRVAARFPPGTPAEATRFRGNRFAMSGIAGDGGRGPGGAHPCSGQRRRPLFAVHCDALCCSGWDCRGSSSSGQNRKPRSGCRGARGCPVLAPQALYSAPSCRLLRHFPNLPFSLAPIAPCEFCERSSGVASQADSRFGKLPSMH